MYLLGFFCRYCDIIIIITILKTVPAGFFMLMVNIISHISMCHDQTYSAESSFKMSVYNKKHSCIITIYILIQTFMHYYHTHTHTNINALLPYTYSYKH